VAVIAEKKKEERVRTAAAALAAGGAVAAGEFSPTGAGASPIRIEAAFFVTFLAALIMAVFWLFCSVRRESGGRRRATAAVLLNVLAFAWKLEVNLSCCEHRCSCSSPLSARSDQAVVEPVARPFAETKNGIPIVTFWRK